MNKLIALLTLAAVCGSVMGPLAAADKDEKEKKKPEVVFKRMDKDGNGKLSLAEFKGKREGKKAERAEKAFKRLDKNSDGSLTLEEFKARGKKKDS